MYNFVRKTEEICKFIKENKEIFILLQKYMMPGCYESNEIGNIIYKVDDQFPNKPSTFDEASKRKNPLKPLITLCKKKNACVKEKNDGGFRGTYIVISSSREEYKVFSWEDALVLTKYLNKEKMNKIIDNRRIFEKYFNVPQIKKVDVEDHICVEHRINHVEYGKKQAINYLLSCYPDFWTEYHEKRYSDDWNEIGILFENIFKIPVDTEKLKALPEVISHGDLWSSNVMYDGEKYYITDFENCGYKYFLYDFFMYIYTEYFLLDNSQLMDDYFNGEFDKLLFTAFQSVGVTYDSESKKTYFLGYLSRIYYEKWKNAGGKRISERIQLTISRYGLGE